MSKNTTAIKPSFWFRSRQLLLLYNSIAFLLIASSLFLLYFSYFENRFFPNLFIDDIQVGGYTKEEARDRLEKRLITRQENWPERRLEISFQESSSSISLQEIEANDNFDEVLAEAFLVGHQGNFWQKFLTFTKSSFQKQRFYTQIRINEEKLQTFLRNFIALTDLPGEKASAILHTSGKIESLEINPGSIGLHLDYEENWQQLQRLFDQNLKNLKDTDFQVIAITQNTAQPLDAEGLREAQERIKKLIGKSIVFQFAYQKFTLNDQDLVSFLAFPDGISQEDNNQIAIAEKVATWAKQINQPGKNAVFSYDPETLIVHEFQADEAATVLDQEKTVDRIVQDLEKIENDPEDKTQFEEILPVTTAPAAISLASTNDLGINELIGFGESWYAHSIPARIHNVALTASKINNIIIPPGEEFSFNKALGEVSTETEYKAAYIIQNGQTVLAPGGGVCQVSSTLFRALLDSGLKVSKRLAHSYRVSYYEINNEPGFDATVYSGNIDLRFINDTEHFILLHFDTDSENLYMDAKIYGTSDGRTTEIIGYRKWGYQAAAAPVYLTDPSLAPGQIKQIDWSATGIKAEFTNVIKDKNGQVLREDSYYSNYQPWSAKYLVGPSN
jgi:vancomycin resistance protein YoaR